MKSCYDIVEEVGRFNQLRDVVEGGSWEHFDEYGWLYRPERTEVDLKGKDIGLTVLGLTHGNEWAGIAVVNHVMDLIASGTVRPAVPVAFMLGNVPAALKNKRFLEKDLNRSFAAPEVTHWEQVRARELMPTFAKTARLLDFHQTLRACDRPFFIFPYSSSAFEFARMMCPEQSIVTHWGKPFSTEGQCTDEYTNGQGGVGVSLELGQNGFDPYQIASGVHACLRAIEITPLSIAGSEKPIIRERQGPIYTFGHVIPWPEATKVDLEPGWDNFSKIGVGDVIGYADEQKILADREGWTVFAKYLTREQQVALTTRPTELCRILKQIQVSDLPTTD